MKKAIDLEKSFLVTPSEIVNSGKDHLWMLKYFQNITSKIVC